MGDDSKRLAAIMDAATPLRLSVIVYGYNRCGLSAHLGISLFTRTLGGADLCSRALPARPHLHLRLCTRSGAIKARLGAGRIEFRLWRIDTQFDRAKRDDAECCDVVTD